MDRVHRGPLNSPFAGKDAAFADLSVIFSSAPCRIESEASIMRSNPFSKLDGFTLAFPFLLILAGIFLLVSPGAGVLSLDTLERFWPLTIVAAGLVDLDPMRHGEN